jgi:glycosyltransferase involved in cell wall biosynthesis
MRFSLIIPVAPYRNAEILNSIKELDFPEKKYELIVEPGTNPSENRNRGFEKSKGEIIVLLDDDAVVHKDLLKNADNFFKEYPEVDIVGGPQLTPLDEKGFAKISGYALSSKFGGWNTSNRYEKKKLNLDADDTYLTSAIMFCKRKVMDKVKFDVNLWPGEDPKFIADAKKEDFKIAYNPDLIIYHRRRPTLKALIKQIFNYGRVGPLKEKFSETIKRPFFLVPSLFIFYLISIIIFLDLRLFGINLISNGILFFPLVLYIILNLLFSFYESVKKRDARGIFLLPFIFSVIHISYGAGRIYGYLKKVF